MSNLIQIKRSSTTAAPTSLANGELAFTSNGDILYIGSPDGSNTVTAIGGKRFPGTLTANQALVANSTSYLDVIKTANLYIGSFTVNTINAVANTTHLGSASNNELTTTWGVKTYVDSSIAYTVTSGSSNTQVLFNNSGVVGGDADLTFDTANNTLQTNNLIVSGTINRSPVITLAGDLSGNVTLTDLQSATLTATIVADSVALGTDTTGNYVATLTAGNGLTGSVSAEAATPTIAVVANNGLAANSTGVFVVPGDGIISNTSGVFVNGGSTLTVNTSGVHVNSQLQLTDLTLSGNLTVTGTLVTVDATNLTVNDSIIELGRNNGADVLDIGFYGTYNDGTERFTGLIWDTSSDVFELFSNTTVEPTTTLDTAGVGYTRATLKSYLNTGAFVSNSSVVNITANSTVSSAIVANTLSLTSALTGTSGGTGLSSYTNQDILVANSTNGFNKLGLGTDGQVLQSNGTALIYSMLDGGSF